MLWSNQTQSARMSVIYITAGALIDVWTAVYYFLILRPDANRNSDGGVGDSSMFWVVGFFLTGLALLVIGLLVGRIGQAAGKAEVAPATTTPVNPDGASVPVPQVVNTVRQPVNPAPVQSAAPVA